MNADGSSGKQLTLSSSSNHDRYRIPQEDLVIDYESRRGHDHGYSAKWLGANVVAEEVPIDSTMSDDNKARVRLAVRETATEWITLKHLHIMRLFGYCDGEMPAFVRERTSNQTLSQFVRDHPHLLWAKLRELVSAVMFLKKRGFDLVALTPHDILIGRDRRVKVAGFRRSPMLRSASGESCDPRDLLQFVAPERMGARDAPPTLEALVYSLGMCALDALQAVEESFPMSNERKRPAIATDEQWELVTRMCCTDSTQRATLSEVNSAFQLFAADERAKSGNSKPSLATSVSHKTGVRAEERHHSLVQRVGAIHERLEAAPLAQTDAQTNARGDAKWTPAQPATSERVDVSREPEDAAVLGTNEMAETTPLTANGDLDAVHGLVDLGADVSASNQREDSPLLLATRNSHLDVVTNLINRGASVNVANGEGRTALSLTAATTQLDVAHCLVDHGAVIYAPPGSAAAVSGSEEDQLCVEGGNTTTPVPNCESLETTIASGKQAPQQNQGHTQWQRLRTPGSAAGSEVDEGPSSLGSGWFISPLEVELHHRIESGDGEGEHLAKWLDADVVVKFMSRTPKKAFRAEAALWHRLRHPNLLKLYGACDVGRPFFVCEYASNGRLVDYLAACEPDRRTTWKLLYQAALGLRFLHQRNVVHGNLHSDTSTPTTSWSEAMAWPSLPGLD